MFCDIAREIKALWVHAWRYVWAFEEWCSSGDWMNADVAKSNALLYLQRAIELTRPNELGQLTTAEFELLQWTRGRLHQLEQNLQRFDTKSISTGCKGSGDSVSACMASIKLSLFDANTAVTIDLPSMPTAAAAIPNAAGVEWVPTSSFAKCFQGPNASTKAQRFAESRFAESGQYEKRDGYWHVVRDVMQRAIDAERTRQKLTPDGKLYGK